MENNNVEYEILKVPEGVEILDSEGEYELNIGEYITTSQFKIRFVDETLDYFYIEPISFRPANIKLNNITSDSELYYSFGNKRLGTWYKYDHDTGIKGIKGRIYFRGNLTTGGIGVGTFKVSEGTPSIMQSNFYVGGHITSLIKNSSFKDEDNVEDKIFSGLFSGSSVYNAEELKFPNGTIGEYAYNAMFRGCTSLIMPPEKLPSSTISEGAYYEMFYGCESLITTPEILATRFTGSVACARMFSGCTSLASVQGKLSVSELTSRCFQYMFDGCTVLKNPPSFDGVNKLETGCCYGMFNQCTSLLSTPEGLDEMGDGNAPNSCYGRMFYECTSLESAPERLGSTTLGYGCYQSMFYGCKNLKNVSSLPAEDLKDKCYEAMFHGCNKISGEFTFGAKQFYGITIKDMDDETHLCETLRETLSEFLPYSTTSTVKIKGDCDTLKKLKGWNCISNSYELWNENGDSQCQS